jgi:thiosulfate dehydrogenase
MENGEGKKIKGTGFSGYLYPPIAGNDSFNDGAGMNRVITAAEFIKGNMPFGATYDAPLVTDEEAYHLAAYINTLERPVKAGKELDFPDKKLKPVSTPYGPWADDFSPEQHKFGPFTPIFDYYKKQFNLNKDK